jgi:hypothetical protein
MLIYNLQAQADLRSTLIYDRRLFWHYYWRFYLPAVHCSETFFHLMIVTTVRPLRDRSMKTFIQPARDVRGYPQSKDGAMVKADYFAFTGRILG